MTEIKKTVSLQIRRVSTKSFEVSRKQRGGQVTKSEMVTPGQKYRVEPPALCQTRFLDFDELERMGEGEHVLEFVEQMREGTQKIDPQKPSS